MGFEDRPLLDISPRISPRLGVFPGDTPFSQSVALSFEQGHHLKLSSVTTTLHLGAHVDAPCHYLAGGADMSAVDLRRYLGACEVVSCPTARGGLARRDDLPALFSPRTPRVLLRTGTFPDPESWNSDFAGVHPDLVDWLADAGVELLGIDTPSLDPESSKTLSAHTRVAARGMAILEGIVLGHVADGLYDLIALPLALEGGDASPVRAVLMARTGTS